jgi:hypothetical protein
VARFITSAQHLEGGGTKDFSGEDPNGEWTMSRAEVVGAIQAGQQFLVEHPTGHYVDTMIMRDGALEYVATVHDGTKIDNIGSLPRTE